MRAATAALMLLTLAAPLHAQAPSKVSFKEVPLTHVLSGFVQGSLRVSPDYRHAAYVAERKGKCLAVADGKESREYELIDASTLRLGPDGQVAFSARRGGKDIAVLGRQETVVDGRVDPYNFVLSPDGMRLACKVQRGAKALVVLDGVEGKIYDGVWELVFSPAGPRLVYVAWRGTRCLMVVNTEEQPAFDRTWAPTFSPDGKRLAYLARRGEKQLVMVDAKPGVEYDRIGEGTVRFSADGKRVGYAARHGKKHRIVIDGREGPEYDWIGQEGPVFSPDGRCLAYRAGRARQQFVVVDGKEGKPYRLVGRPQFLAEGNRVMYWVFLAHNRRMVVIGDVEGKVYDGVDRFSMRGSPDGKHVAYRAWKGRKSVLVVDGKERHPCDGLQRGSLLFSPDGAHLAWILYRPGARRVVRDGVPGKPYALPMHLAFSPDGRHLAYWALGKGWWIVVDGVECKSYGYDRRAAIVFDGPRSFYTLASKTVPGRGAQIVRIEAQITARTTAHSLPADSPGVALARSGAAAKASPPATDH